jgi:hypothetical protein
MNNKTYDYIVFGATLPGIIFAVKKSLAGHSVLLTNMFGFPGGSVTEQLNCYQNADETQLQGLAKEIYRSIAPDNFDRTIVNPETVKFVLQQILEILPVHLYFHVTPKKIGMNGAGIFEVSLLAKEGSATVTGKKIVDASEDFYGAVLLNRKRTIQKRCVNLFISRPLNDKFLSFEKIAKAVKLSDGRYWITLKLNSQDDLFAENETHDLLDTFRTVLEDSHSRIQVLPLGAQTVYGLEQGDDFKNSFSTIDDILGSSMKPSEQFRKGSMLESALNKF